MTGMCKRGGLQRLCRQHAASACIPTHVRPSQQAGARFECIRVSAVVGADSQHLHDAETQAETTERRQKESLEVDGRVTSVSDVNELKQQLRAAGNKLVLLELQGDADGVCDSGFMEEPELHWKLDQVAAERKRLEACVKVKHAFQRTARECPDVVFLQMQVSDDASGEALKEELGVSLLPSVLFYRTGELLWAQEGYKNMETQMGQGVLYYGNSAGGGVKASEYVQEVGSTQRELNAFIANPDKNMLTVLYVATMLCEPCIKVFPAVLALARNFEGHAAFGRILADEEDDPSELLRKLGVLEVPTFIFYRGGVEVGRHVGSSRGDLIGKILELQTAAGIRPPPPPPREKAPARARSSSSRARR